MEIYNNLILLDNFGDFSQVQFFYLRLILTFRDYSFIYKYYRLNL